MDNGFLDSIKNITFIYLYDKYDMGSSYPCLKIKYDVKELICDYRDPLFPSLLSKVWEVYNHEKKAIVFGSFTKDDYKSALNVGKYKVNLAHLQNKSILDSDKEIRQIKKYETYLKNIIKQIINIFKPDSDITFEPICGHKNKFSFTYNIDGKYKIVTLICKIKGNKLSFKTSYIDGMVLPIVGEIDIEYDKVYIYFSTPNKKLEFTKVYNVFDDVEILPPKEEDLIKMYFDLCGLDIYDRIIKTSENNYLFFSFQPEENNSILTSGHITIGDKIMIDYKKEYGTFEHYLFTPTESIEVNIVIAAVDKENILIEKHVSKVETSTYEYKNTKEGKYAYELICANYDSLQAPFDYTRYEFLEPTINLDSIRNSSKVLTKAALIKEVK